jgi:hypothetical protein
VTLWLLGVWLFVLGAKLVHIQRFAVAMPITDMWNAEGELYLKLHRGTLSVRDLVAPHNEHRVAYTRVLDLALLALNGQWDNRAQCVAGAALYAGIAALLSGIVWSLGSRPARSPGEQRRPPGTERPTDVASSGSRWLGLAAVGLVLAVFAPPFSMNDLIGFNSQYSFVLGFAVVTIWLMGCHRPLSARWWLGLLAAFLGLFTAGSGLLAALPVAALAVLGWRTGALRAAESLTSLGACVLVLSLGAWLSVRVAQHEVLHAHTATEFLIALGKGLAVPFHDGPSMSFWMWLPFATLLAARLWPRAETPALDRFLIGVGLWGLLQAAAVAYSRGAGGAGPDQRHLDLLTPSILVNGVSALVVQRLARLRFRKWVSRISLAGVVGWFAVSAWGLFRLADVAIRVASPGLGAWCAERERNVRDYVVSRGAESLDDKTIPFPDWGRSLLTGYLEDPYLRTILPAEIRERVRLEFSRTIPGGLETLPRPVDGWWSSYSARRVPGSVDLESAPARIRLPFLRFGVAGNLDGKWNRLEVSAPGGSNQTVMTRRGKGGGKSAVTVRSPGVVVVVRARAPRLGPDDWFAFTEPVEIGWVSWLASRLAGMGTLLLEASVALLAALLLLGVSERRPLPDSFTPSHRA